MKNYSDLLADLQMLVDSLNDTIEVIETGASKTDIETGASKTDIEVCLHCDDDVLNHIRECLHCDGDVLNHIRVCLHNGGYDND